MFARIDDSGGCVLHLLPVSGGAIRVVGNCDRINGRYDWLPDGSGIVAGIKPEGGGQPSPLSVLRLDTGQWQAMRYPIDAGDVDFGTHSLINYNDLLRRMTLVGELLQERPQVRVPLDRRD